VLTLGSSILEDVMDAVTPDSDATRALLEQAAAGDPQAFDQLFARHRPALRDFVELRFDARLRWWP
jgi:hypothetical protein